MRDKHLFWPWRPESPNPDRWSAGHFNQFQRGEINDQPRPGGFANDGDSWDGNYYEGGWSLVESVAPYFGYKYPYGDPYRQTVMYDNDALGPTFVCALHQPKIGESSVAAWDGRSRYGTQEHGLVDTNGGGNDNHFMSYNYYPMGGTWRNVQEGSRKAGQPITFGIQWPPSNWRAAQVQDSMLLFSDMVIAPSSDPADPLFLPHRPPPGGTASYVNTSEWSDPNRIYNTFFEAYGGFVQNNAFQDGSVSSVRGDSHTLSETHARLNNRNLIPLDTH